MNLEKEPEMLAYHNDPVIKADILAQLQAHYDADEIIQGHYWENGKGCAVGCTIYGSDHAAYERLFGIPAGLAYLEDTIFEHLPNGDAKQWPLRFMRAIVPGADLSMAGPKFLRWVLHSIALPNAGAGAADSTAHSAAYIAVYRAAHSATNPAARSAADSAAYAAVYRAAHSAAYIAADSAAWGEAYNAAHSAAWGALANKLIELLEAA